MEFLAKLIEEQKKLAGERLQFPLTKLQIDQDKGQFRVFKDGQIVDYLNEIDIVVVDRFNEFYYYDVKLKRKTITSTIERKPSHCKDRSTGTLISELKKHTNDLSFQIHLVSVLLNYEKEKQTVLQLHGVGAQQFITFIENNKDYWKNRLITKLKVKLQEMKNGRVIYYQPVFETYLVSSDDEAKTILENYKQMLSKFEEFVSKYNNKYTNSVEYEDEYDLKSQLEKKQENDSLDDVTW